MCRTSLQGLSKALRLGVSRTRFHTYSCSSAARSACLCVCVSARAQACTCVYVCACMCIHCRSYIRLCVCVCVCVCVHIQTFTHKCICIALAPLAGRGGGQASDCTRRGARRGLAGRCWKSDGTSRAGVWGGNFAGQRLLRRRRRPQGRREACAVPEFKQPKLN